MESAAFPLTTTTTTLTTVSRVLNRHFHKRPYSTYRTPLISLPTKTLLFASLSTTNLSLLLLPLIRCRADCMSSSAASFGTSSGSVGGEIGDGDGGGEGEGGAGGSDGGDSKSKLDVGGSKVSSALPPDVIILDVGGMSCEGCAASVKTILESQPQVSTASVNLTTETALVRPMSEAKAMPNWQQQLGEALAKHLTVCGFKSNLRVIYVFSPSRGRVNIGGTNFDEYQVRAPLKKIFNLNNAEDDFEEKS